MKIKNFLFISLFSMICGMAQAQPEVIAHRGFWNTPGSDQNSLASLTCLLYTSDAADEL